MCGIAGVAAFDLDEASALTQVGFLRHRGPDSVGIHVGSGAIVGQSRLSIIDILGGDPPITDESGALGVAFNGEIYNFRELQRELRSRGHDLKTDCDTEVIAHLAEDHEPESLCRRLDGMFAFALWDERKRRLVLGRDRLGKKPLYYWQGSNGDLVFGSEIKAVLAEPRVPRRISSDGIDSYLAFGYVPTPQTFFEGIRSVPPGHVVVAEGGSLEVREYWSPPVRTRAEVEATPLNLETGAVEVRRVLREAVAKRLVADVPLGAFLSGGVDSSAIVALMAELSARPVKTFTIGFEDERGFDERPYARQVSALFGTEHVEFVVDPDKAELIERLVWHHDQPFGDSSALPTYLLSELTRRHVTVALCGDGGDELFGGYERFSAALAVDAASKAPRGLTSKVARAISHVPDSVLRGRGPSVRRFLERVDVGLPGALLAWVGYVAPEWQERLRPGRSRWGERDYDRIWAETSGASPLDRVLLLNLRTYLLDDLLPKIDRMSMAHGLEVRSPILDDAMVDLAFRLRPSLKLRGWDRKRVLKAAVRDLLPPEILNRRKRGFGVPLDEWFRVDLRSYVEGMLTSSTTQISDLVDAAAVQTIVREHMAGATDHRHAIWSLLTLEVFLRQEAG
ncbi:MAG TPA: asparagine synthase (glutamine-hydrolyzing) [Acidimicrobiales bacterium]|nr:asparagine synthase (glutamine-hydrolyzing) [Acidimicrobiales bacterium]